MIRLLRLNQVEVVGQEEQVESQDNFFFINGDTMYLFKRLSVRMGQNTKPGLTTDAIYEVVGCNPAREQFLVIDDLGQFVFIDIYNTRAVKDEFTTTDNPVIDQGTEGGGDTSGTEREAEDSTPAKPSSTGTSTPKATGRFGKTIPAKGK